MKIYFFVFVVMATLLHATPNQIRDLKVESVVGTKIVLSCTVPTIRVSTIGPSKTAPIDKIELRIDTVSNRLTTKNYDACKVVQVVSSPGPVTTKVTFTVEDLEPNTKYYFACKAFDGVWGVVSNMVNGTTGNKPANKIIEVEWTYENDGGETPEFVVVSHGYTPAMDEKPIAVLGTTTRVNLAGLRWGVNYYWQVTTVLGDQSRDSPVRSNSD